MKIPRCRLLYAYIHGWHTKGCWWNFLAYNRFGLFFAVRFFTRVRVRVRYRNLEKVTYERVGWGCWQRYRLKFSLFIMREGIVVQIPQTQALPLLEALRHAGVRLEEQPSGPAFKTSAE